MCDIKKLVFKIDQTFTEWDGKPYFKCKEEEGISPSIFTPQDPFDADAQTVCLLPFPVGNVINGAKDTPFFNGRINIRAFSFIYLKPFSLCRSYQHKNH